MKFFTYVYRDPLRSMIPIYVGKGVEKRPYAHLSRKTNQRLNRRVRKLKAAGLEPAIEVFGPFSEVEALLEEVKLISKYGRLDLKSGTLYNLTDGGEGTSGRIETPESNQKRAAAMTKWLEKPGNFEAREKVRLEKLSSVDTRQRMSDSAQAYWADQRNRDLRKAVMNSNEVKEKMMAGINARASTEWANSIKLAQNDPMIRDRIGARCAETCRARRRLKHPDWTEEQHAARDDALRALAEKRKLKKGKQ